jgi:diguanylate cyclase (GGDEF)-like protein
MQPIDMLSAYVIGGIGALFGAVMMMIAMHGDRRHRGALARCAWGFALLGAGMVHSGFADRAARWPILTLAIAALIGTLGIYRGLGDLVDGHTVGGRRLALEVALLTGLLLLAWRADAHTFALAFHVLCLAVALGIAWTMRRALLAPRNAAEPVVAATLMFYALTWVVALAAVIGYQGPEHRYLVYIAPPLTTAYAVLYALLPLVVGSLVLNLANARLGERLRRQAHTDELTGLYSRRALLERALGWRTRVEARGSAAAVILIDVDHFKSINDGRGHDAGDAVLRALGLRMRGALRRGSLLGRYGGEEFLALVEAPDAAEAVAIAERLREAVGARPFVHAGDSFTVTASLGVAPWPAGDELAQTVSRADAALYAAKHAGRDRVVAWTAHAFTAPAAEAPGTP